MLDWSKHGGETLQGKSSHFLRNDPRTSQTYRFHLLLVKLIGSWMLMIPCSKVDNVKHPLRAILLASRRSQMNRIGLRGIKELTSTFVHQVSARACTHLGVQEPWRI
jgi:hypothetical protein